MYRISLISSIIITIIILSVMFSSTVNASDTAKTTQPAEKKVEKNALSQHKGLIAIAAGIAFGMAAIATALVQSKVGTAGIGALTENPKLLGSVILLIAIPETILVFGFVIAFLLLNKI